MHEIVKINLDNEMDLILAHKRSMKIAELCGLPSSAQTRFSTAVSEIARCSIANGKDSILVLGINVVKATQKEIVAVLTDTVDLKQCNPEAFTYAAKISGNIDYQFIDKKSQTKLSHRIASPGLISDHKINGFKDYFKYEPALSPYDEIRKKNIELIALSEKLSESEGRYRQLTNTLPVLICIVDERNKVLLTNNWLNENVAFPLHTFDRTSMGQFLEMEGAEALLNGWEKCKKSGISFFGQVRLKKGNQLIWHLVSIVPNKTEDGYLNNWLVSFVDINAQKIVEETLKDNSDLKAVQLKLEELNTQLSFKNKELEQFAFIASHDLQEPLRKIMIMLSRAGENLTEEEKQNFFFDRISAAAQRMSNLIKDVLNYSRIDDRDKLLETVDLNAILGEAMEESALIIEERGAALTVDSLPVVKGLGSQLRQLFYNLIINAVKFNNREPRIAIRYLLADAKDFADIATNSSGRYHQISISDNGIGMEAEYSERVFNMFQRLHDRDKYGGNGIGLALCRRVVENHHGFITFESQPDMGTTFKIYLPVS